MSGSESGEVYRRRSTNTNSNISEASARKRGCSEPRRRIGSSIQNRIHDLAKKNDLAINADAARFPALSNSSELRKETTPNVRKNDSANNAFAPKASLGAKDTYQKFSYDSKAIVSHVRAEHSSSQANSTCRRKEDSPLSRNYSSTPDSASGAGDSATRKVTCSAENSNGRRTNSETSIQNGVSDVNIKTHRIKGCKLVSDENLSSNAGISVRLKDGGVEALIDARPLLASSPDSCSSHGSLGCLVTQHNLSSESDKPSHPLPRRLHEGTDNETYLSDVKKGPTSPLSSLENVSKLNSIKDRIRNLNKKDLTDVSGSADSVLSTLRDSRGGLADLSAPSESRSSCRSQVETNRSQVAVLKVAIGVSSEILGISTYGSHSEKQHTADSPRQLRRRFHVSAREAANARSAKTGADSCQGEISQNNPSKISKTLTPDAGELAQTNDIQVKLASPIDKAGSASNTALLPGVSPGSRLPAETDYGVQKETSYSKSRGDAEYSVGRSRPADRDQYSPAKRSTLDQNLAERNDKSCSATLDSKQSEPDVKKKTIECLKAGRKFSWSSDESSTDAETRASESQKKLSDGKSDSIVTSDGLPPEKGQVRRRRLVKRAKKGRLSQDRLFTKKSNQTERLYFIDTNSDGEVPDSSDPESLGTSIFRSETDVLYDSEIYLKESGNMIPSESAIRENTSSSSANSTLHSRDRNSSPKTSEPDSRHLNRSLQPISNDKSLVGDELQTSAVVDNEFEMRSASMTNFHTAKFPVLTSFSSSDMAARYNKTDKENRLAILNQLRSGPGPFGSVSSVSKVSKLTLQSFSATAVLGQLKSKRNLSDSEETYSAPGSDAYSKSGILSSPFSIRKHGFKEDRYSDGEHEITSRLAKLEEDLVIEDVENETHLREFRLSYTLPQNSRLKKEGMNCFTKGPFNVPFTKSVVACDSADDALKSLPDSPFSLLGRFTEDTEKMLSRSAGSFKKAVSLLEEHSSIDTEMSEATVADQDALKELDSGSESERTITHSSTDLSVTMLSAGKDLPNSSNLSTLHRNGLSLPDQSFDQKALLSLEILPVEDMSLATDSSTISVPPVGSITHADKEGSTPKTSPPLSATALHGPGIETEDEPDLAASTFFGKLRRPSYIKARSNDEDDDDCMDNMMNIFAIDKPDSCMADQEMTGIGESSGKRPLKRSRPRLPVVLHDGELDLSNCFQGIETPDAQLPKVGDEPIQLDFAKVGKQEPSSKRVRPRAPVAHPSFLENIPEEKGQNSMKVGANIDDHEKRRRRKPNLAPIFTEETIPEDAEDLRESPKTDQDDKSETGYYSQGSDFVATPKDLSSENLSSSDVLGPEQVYVEKYGDLSNNAARSKSDPMPIAVLESSKLLASGYPLSSSSFSEPSLPRADQAHDRPGSAGGDASMNSSLSDFDRPSRSTTADDDPRTPVSTEAGFDSGYEPPMSPPLLSLPVSSIQVDEAMTPMTEEPPVSAADRKKKASKPEMRRHVLQNLLETELSYVQNLSSMVTMFYKPLKRPENASVIESSLVDEIFFQIPEILVNHEFFLEQLTNRVSNWHDKQIIGDIFVSSFTKCLLMDAYSSFINHFLQAKSAIRQATSARPQFTKYIEQCYREHREKLTLSDLLIMPVQRIPRYVLILKDMLKHTPVEHPDYGNLQLALGEIKTLADRMNKGEMEADRAERDLDRLRDIEATIEGVTDLAAANRKFIRQDLVAEIKGVITKKDRCLFLFSDLLVCTAVRKKNNALRRGSLGLFTGQSAAELNRYKFLWRLALEDVEVSKASNQTNSQWGANKDIEKLEEDLKVLASMCSSAESLSVQHQRLDQVLRELVAEVNQQVAERQALSVPTLPPTTTRIELQVQTEEGPDIFMFIFLSAECKTSWEAYFDDAKQKLSYAKNSFPPEFQYPMPVTKTRSGMQFTCAAPSNVSIYGGLRSHDQSRGDMWICNSDGYVGQVCLLTVIPEAALKASLSVCSARIVCISAVPGTRMNGQLDASGPRDNGKVLGSPSSANRKKSKGSKGSLSSLKQKKSFPSESDDEFVSHGAESIIAFDSSDDEDGDIESAFIGGPAAFGGRMSPDGSSLGTVESIEGERDSSDDDNFRHDSSDDDESRNESSRRISVPLSASMSARGDHEFTLKGGLGDLLGADKDEQPTMWLGTEDGSIYVYHADDAIQQRKSKMKMSLGATVNSILYLESKVFVALGSGDLWVYKRDSGKGWNISEPQKIHISQSSSPVACVTTVAGRVWCGCQNQVVLVHASTLKIDHTITISPDPHRSVYKMVSSGLGVWISLQSSAIVRLYHATTYENLIDIDVAPSVHKMLAGADAIIRQHKAACLRITSLLVCKDLLWIGTSAGVILTNPIPNITVHTSVLKNMPGPSGSPHGHTGHVRFLSLVEVPKSLVKSLEQESCKGSASPSPSSRSFKSKDDASVKSGSKDNGPGGTVTLVVSGGDGYEDFRTNAQTEAVGRDDSTNHVLLWRV